VIFVEVIILMGSALIRIIIHMKRLIIWAIKEGKVSSQVTMKIIICLKDGGAIRIRALDGNRMPTHLTGNLAFSSNNKFLQIMTGPLSWRRPWRNLCKLLWPIRKILKLLSEILRHKWDNWQNN